LPPVVVEEQAEKRIEPPARMRVMVFMVESDGGKL
jgi:hypothetical protein